MGYCDPNEAIRNLARLARPPMRMKVSEASARYVKVRTPGGGVGPWDPTIAPYIIEPMDMLASRRHEAVIFAGPARTSKTQSLVDCWAGYMVKCDPSDMLIIQTSQETARDYSKMRVNRLLRNSPDIGAEQSGSRQDDNTYDKWFKAGVALKIGWPSINQLSGKDFKYVALTDYDRMPEDIDKEGSPFELAKKRTQTFMSRGMTMAESSPGYEITEANWKPTPAAPHEAPPTRGILALYNLGDRRRRYWRCPHCNEYYLQPPGIDGFSFNHSRDLFGITDTELRGEVFVICTSCGATIEEQHKRSMSESGLWVPEGCHIEREGKTYGLAGTPRKSAIASFWMSGAEAAYQSWRSIVQNYLNAMRQYDVSGDEEALKATANVDQGTAYLPQRLATDATTAVYEQRKETIERYTVPEGVRALMATVDVQGGRTARFVVQVVGIGVHNEKWLIDRYSITKSARLDDNGDALPIDPAAHAEDWDLLTSKVVNSTYKLSDPTKEMRVYRIGVDTGGEAGVTERAYEWWRGLKRQHLADRVRLLKGASTMTAPKVKKSYPDSTNRKDRKSGGRGDVPVWLINTDLIKDAVSNDLARTSPGPGYLHFPDWLESWFFDELHAEYRDDKGKWQKKAKRNEAFDLLVYLYAVLFDLKIERINWEAPPSWLAPLDSNSEIVSPEQRREMQAKKAAPRSAGRQVRFAFN